MRLGELLIMNGLITEVILEQALQRQQEGSSLKLGELLIDAGSITERQLVEALEFQLGVPVVNMSGIVLDESVIKLIPEGIARKHTVLPLEAKGRRIRVAMIDPLNQEAVKEIQMATGMSVQPCLATRTDAEEAVLRYYGEQESVSKWQRILEEAVQAAAKGIHLDPREEGIVVTFRIDNQRRAHTTIPRKSQLGWMERIKNDFQLSLAENKLPQEGTLRLQVAEKTVDLRLSTLPTKSGESLYVGIVDAAEANRKLDELSFLEPNLQKVQLALSKPTGLVLVSGPWSSGKTTTLYSFLEHMSKDNGGCITVEERISRRISGALQVEVNESIGLTASAALRSVMWQEPGAVLVDELSTGELLQMAARGSLGGRMVMGALHAGSVEGTLKRVLDTGSDPYLFAASVTCIVSQRMARKVCKQCAQSVPMTDEEAAQFAAFDLQQPDDAKAGKGLIGNFRSFVSAQISGKPTVIKGSGCSVCSETGFKGWVPLQEVLLVDESLRSVLLTKPSSTELKQQLEHRGFKPMLYDGLVKARSGLTTVDEVLRTLNSP